MTDEKILDKLQKIKAHADSAKAIGSEAEAQAFAEMLQKLLLKHNLAMTDIEFERHEKEEPVEMHQVDWEDVGVRQVRVAWIEKLASLVARAHFCRILVHRGSSNITLVGRISNTKVAEYMLVTLTRAAWKLSRRATYWNEDGSQRSAAERGGAGFRAAFLDAFINRLAERFAEERVATETSSSTALVRLNKADAAVTDFMKSLGTKRAAIVRGARTDRNAQGFRAGREAANAINLHGKAVNGSATARGQLR